jgi:hypothetical protein
MEVGAVEQSFWDPHEFVHPTGGKSEGEPDRPTALHCARKLLPMGSAGNERDQEVGAGGVGSASES